MSIRTQPGPRLFYTYGIKCSIHTFFLVTCNWCLGLYELYVSVDEFQYEVCNTVGYPYEYWDCYKYGFLLHLVYRPSYISRKSGDYCWEWDILIFSVPFWIFLGYSTWSCLVRNGVLSDDCQSYYRNINLAAWFCTGILNTRYSETVIAAALGRVFQVAENWELSFGDSYFEIKLTDLEINSTNH